jgi:hypothetical protein
MATLLRGGRMPTAASRGTTALGTAATLHPVARPTCNSPPSSDATSARSSSGRFDGAHGPHSTSGMLELVEQF